MLKINGVGNAEAVIFTLINFALIFCVYNNLDMLLISFLGITSCLFNWYKRTKYLKYNIKIFSNTWSPHIQKQELRWGLFVVPVLYAAGETFVRLAKQGVPGYHDAASILFLVIVGAWSMSEFFLRIKV